ncbi:MAG: RnfABCDGE type electron transport complex subunit B [Synergistaceae bacterium]|jgi:Na+-translocating ferredoxin:NAD+ oxidoreductase RNF subunit RnfB|nr:RnfABCDGE type electron transport complex subunit B [Synergistaceae bacterium]
MTFIGVLYPLLVMGVLGLAFGALLAFASIKFFVKVDERVSKIREILPGANCGGCGYPGCDGYADSIVNGGAATNRCAAGGASLAAGIASIMGVAAEEAVPKIAFRKCNGSPDASARNAAYVGIGDCRSAVVVPSGSPNSCPFGCLGLGTCTKVCLFGALSIVNGLSCIDIDKCVGCGACVSACPKSVLTLIPKTSNIQVICNSKWRGPDVKRVCSVGCIGCGICARACQAGAITVEGNLAKIDPAKCTNCGACAEKCPAKCIGCVVLKREEEEKKIA